ncbi:MAG: hypothetical protein U0842_07530 [Candidatus Binatia bacterium]
MKRAFACFAWFLSSLPAIALLLTIVVGVVIRISMGRLPTYGTYVPPGPVHVVDTLRGVFTGFAFLSLLIWPFVEIVVANHSGGRSVRRQAALYLLSLAALVALFVADPGGFSGWLLD